MARIELKKIKKAYGDVVVLKEMSLTIADQEFLVLLGPSGCGKSTALRMIAGLETVDEGEIWIGDRRVDRLEPGERDIAMVFQNYALYPHMTVRENIAFCLENLRLPKREINERVEATARMLELGPLLNRLPAELSGGQRQRVAIGRAVVREPKAFLMDEPLSNLDAKLRDTMRAELAKLHDELQISTVYVTHDQVEAMTLADRIVILNAGIIQQVAPPLETYRRPANRFVAGFIGSPSMNFFRLRFADGALTGEGVAITPAADLRGLLESRGKTEYWVGVRPQKLEPCPTAEAEFTGRASVVEPYGAETYVTVQVGEGTLLARVVPEEAPAKGENCGFKSAAGALYFFDPDGEEAIYS